MVSQTAVLVSDGLKGLIAMIGAGIFSYQIFLLWRAYTFPRSYREVFLMTMAGIQLSECVAMFIVSFGFHDPVAFPWQMTATFGPLATVINHVAAMYVGHALLITNYKVVVEAKIRDMNKTEILKLENAPKILDLPSPLGLLFSIVAIGYLVASTTTAALVVITNQIFYQSIRAIASLIACYLYLFLFLFVAHQIFRYSTRETNVSVSLKNGPFSDADVDGDRKLAVPGYHQGGGEGGGGGAGDNARKLRPAKNQKLVVGRGGEVAEASNDPQQRPRKEVYAQQLEAFRAAGSFSRSNAVIRSSPQLPQDMERSGEGVEEEGEEERHQRETSEGGDRMGYEAAKAMNSISDPRVFAEESDPGLPSHGVYTRDMAYVNSAKMDCASSPFEEKGTLASSAFVAPMNVQDSGLTDVAKEKGTEEARGREEARKFATSTSLPRNSLDESGLCLGGMFRRESVMSIGTESVSNLPVLNSEWKSEAFLEAQRNSKDMQDPCIQDARQSELVQTLPNSPPTAHEDKASSDRKEIVRTSEAKGSDGSDLITATAAAAKARTSEGSSGRTSLILISSQEAKSQIWQLCKDERAGQNHGQSEVPRRDGGASSASVMEVPQGRPVPRAELDEERETQHGHGHGHGVRDEAKEEGDFDKIPQKTPQLSINRKEKPRNEGSEGLGRNKLTSPPGNLREEHQVPAPISPDEEEESKPTTKCDEVKVEVRDESEAASPPIYRKWQLAELEKVREANEGKLDQKFVDFNDRNTEEKRSNVRWALFWKLFNIVFIMAFIVIGITCSTVHKIQNLHGTDMKSSEFFDPGKYRLQYDLGLWGNLIWSMYLAVYTSRMLLAFLRSHRR